jgi:hypothetical protein
MRRFAKLLGGIDIKYKRGSDAGAFRVTTEADMAGRTSMVHVDTPDFSALIHLSKGEAEGTYFYRHRRLGIDRVSHAENAQSAENEEDQAQRAAIYADTLDLTAWELIHSVPMKYNRLLIFDGKYFHSGAQRLTGSSLAEGRMTQNFFFYRA